MTEITSFEALPLAKPLQRALRDNNYTTPTPIQAQAIPHLLEYKDLLGAAQTGTGKTAAFALPILHHMDQDRYRVRHGCMRALILTPTRELAVQIGKSFETYGKHVRAYTALVYGGVAAGPQIKALHRGIDVLVATPGRLLDLYRQGHVDFSEIEFFVLDEADRMLDMGFIHDIKKIVAELPEDRQSLFFSATLSPKITQLAETILKDPVEVRIAPKETTAEAINHKLCLLHHEDKVKLLETLIDEQNDKSDRNLTLVFSRTKHGADRLAKNLSKAGYKAGAIHGNKTQGARQRALEQFRQGKLPILVATDVAARGIDVKDITLVINFDLPDEPEAYVHRIGRTARGGATGTALSFVTSNNWSELHAIEQLISQEIPLHDTHPFHREEMVARRFRKPKSGGSKGKKKFNNANFRGKGDKPRSATAKNRHNRKTPGHRKGHKPVHKV